MIYESDDIKRNLAQYAAKGIFSPKITFILTGTHFVEPNYDDIKSLLESHKPIFEKSCEKIKELYQTVEESCHA